MTPSSTASSVTGTRPACAADHALHDFAEKLTREPWTVTKDDVEALRGHGFTDVQLSDAVQVISYFNYVNRIADGLGVDLEDDMPPLG